MNEDTAFHIEQLGSWPLETYKISPCATVLDPTLGYLPFINQCLFEKTYINEITNFHQFSFVDIITSYNTLTQEKKMDILSSSAYLNWNLSAHRLSYNLGPQFNYFSIVNNPGVDINFRESYSYILFPSKLYLKPLSITKNFNSWSFNVSATLSNFEKYFFSEKEGVYEVIQQNINRNITGPSSLSVLPSSNSLALVFNLSSYRNYLNHPLLTFSNIYNPFEVTGRLERTSNSVIAFDSPILTYDISYTPKGGDPENIRQILPLIYPTAFITTYPTYILNHSSHSDKKQIFQFIQKINDDELNKSELPNLTELEDTFNCIVSSSLNLSNTVFTYESKYDVLSPITFFNHTTGTPNSVIGITCDVYSEILLYSQIPWTQTFSSFKLNSTNYKLNSPIPLSNCRTNVISWTTTKPPHFYSYSASVSSLPSVGFTSLIDTHNLTFGLSAKPLYYIDGEKTGDTAYITLSTFIQSEHGDVFYNFSDYNSEEYVKFENVFPDNSCFEFGEARCFYGPNYDQPYDILNAPWIPALSAAYFKILYTGGYGFFRACIHPTLSSENGYLSTKINKGTYFEMFKDIPQTNYGTPVFLDDTIVNIGSVEASCAHLTAYPNFPTRDLTDSYISWSFFPADSNAEMYTVDINSNIISKISPNEPLLFSDQTNRVKLDNLGFDTFTLILSSQKYNEIAGVPYFGNLFDVFAEKKLSIGISQPIDNLNITRTFELTAAVPFGGKIYPLPSDCNMAWNWMYRNDDNPITTPIKAFYGKNRTPYTWGSYLDVNLISAIYVEAVPEYSKGVPDIASLKFMAKVDDEGDTVSSTFEFFLDEFPDRSILNTDFTVSYANFLEDPNGLILDTKNDHYVITRPNDGTNFFLLSSYGDSSIWPDTTYVWTISDNAVGLHPYRYTQYKNNTTSLTINPSATVTLLSLSALSAWPTNWRLPNILSNYDFPFIPVHNHVTSITIYTPSAEYLNRKFEFITYPEYAWLGTKELTLLDKDNYSLSPSNTAYKHKISESQAYWLSANKIFEDYDFFVTSKKTFFYSSSTKETRLELPYHTGLSSISGTYIAVSGYDFMTPPNQPMFYYKPDSTALSASLQLYYYQISAENVPANSAVDLSPFAKAPTAMVEYQISATVSFELSSNYLDLDYNRDVYVSHVLETLPESSPARLTLENSTILYSISSQYWQTVVSLPGQSGSYKLFSFGIGDPFELGFVSNQSTNLIKIKPLEFIATQRIPGTTFSNYSLDEWPGERDLWLTLPYSGSLDYFEWKSLTARTSTVQPSLFFSDIIAVTGQNVYIIYNDPNDSPENPIAFYETNFGEKNEFVISSKGEKVFYSYSTPGSFYVSYTIHYLDGRLVSGTHPDPIIIKPYWTSYNQEGLRILTEESLNLPYPLSAVEIQPNEWGDVDIFNTSIIRLYDNLKYLQENIQTINTDSPSVYYGWLGCNSSAKAEGIQWFTKSWNAGFYSKASLASNIGSSYFTNVKQAVQNSSYLYVLDDRLLRIFKDDSSKPSEVFISNVEDFYEEFVEITYFDVGEDPSLVYICDVARNRIVILNIDIEAGIFNFSVGVGGFGERSDTNKFNAPTEVKLTKTSVMILDYNNRCIKEYSKDLNWIHTYFIEEFLTDRPVSMHSNEEGLVYVLTENYNVYILDTSFESVLFKFYLQEISIFNSTVARYDNPLYKILLDEAGEFLYISTTNHIFKYSAVGSYISTLDIFGSGQICKAPNKHLLLSYKHYISKIQDVVSLFKIGEGLPSSSWSLDQIKLKSEDLASDLNYNKAFYRLSQNIKTFRNNLNSKFVKITDKSNLGLTTVTYFSLIPISIRDLPQFDLEVESDYNGVGVNELHIPQVLNREITRLHNSLEKLKLFLEISYDSVPNIKIEGAGVSNVCPEPFCWSWKALSCYDVTLPVIRICRINPITYTELKRDYSLNYAPSKTWGEAYSGCCNSAYATAVAENPFTQVPGIEGNVLETEDSYFLLIDEFGNLLSWE